jgi:methylated-DNA-protein-cysteine methyltransferase-like protein
MAKSKKNKSAQKKVVKKKAANRKSVGRTSDLGSSAGGASVRSASTRKIATGGRASVAKRTAARKPATANSAAAPARKSASSPREKLIAVRPSGSKDDSFFDLVHEVARQIPIGRVTSYGAIGKALGTRSSARMVGWAMNACHLSPTPVPAHRVVNSAGLLTGRHHFKPPEKMQQLLEKEGVVVKDNKVVDFKKLFWDPAQEL